LAARAGTTVAALTKLDLEAAKQRRAQILANLHRTIQYSPVMRFTLDKPQKKYRVERRCYRGDSDWILLSFGSLPTLLNKYLKHIGKESFFDLM
jgi:hypothetical protein